MGRPRIGKGRRVVIEDEVMDDLHLIAAMRGELVSEVIRDALRAHVRRVLKGSGRAA